MATPETQRATADLLEDLTPAPQQTGNAGNAESVIPSLVTAAIIICVFAAFFVTFIGFLTDRYAVLIAGAFALALVTFVWAITAAIALWKIGKSRFTNRRIFRHAGSSK